MQARNSEPLETLMTSYLALSRRATYSRMSKLSSASRILALVLSPLALLCWCCLIDRQSMLISNRHAADGGGTFFLRRGFFSSDDGADGNDDDGEEEADSTLNEAAVR
jgi:hypothetical protein